MRDDGSEAEPLVDRAPHLARLERRHVAAAERAVRDHRRRRCGRLTHGWELRLMLERAGFRDVRMTGDDTNDPPTAKSEVVVFEAKA